jgi:hypothetical protein
MSRCGGYGVRSTLISNLLQSFAKTLPAPSRRAAERLRAEARNVTDGVES